MNASHSSAAHGTPRRATILWLLLIGATILTWTLGQHGAAGPAAVAMLFGIASAKGSVVILEFMGLRRAPLFWRLVTFGWMAFVCVLISLAYWKGMTQ